MGVGINFGTDDEPRYECRHCRKRYRRQHHVCPHCESFSVDPVADVEKTH